MLQLDLRAADRRGDEAHALAHTGSVFEPDAASLARWRGWWRIVRADQWGIFFPGALLGMALPAILYTASIPAGTDLRGLAIASELARALTEKGGRLVPLVLALWLVPLATWKAAAAGFVGLDAAAREFRFLPSRADFFLIMSVRALG